MVDCCRSPPPTARRSLHRVGGCGSWSVVTRIARPSFVAAIALEPTHQLPATVAPSGSPLEQLWTQPSRSRGRAHPAAARGMNTRVDGTVGNDRLYAGPYVLQIESNGDLRTETTCRRRTGCSVGGALAHATEKAMALPVSDVQGRSGCPAVHRRRVVCSDAEAGVVERRGGKGLLWPVVASGGLAAASRHAAVTRLQYDRSPTGTTHTLTNGAYFSSIGTAALSGVLISTFLATR